MGYVGRMTDSEPHHKWEILQTCSELLAALTPADQKIVLAALLEQCCRPEPGQTASARRSSGSRFRRGKGWKG
jgi:hypothetical protein